MMSTQAFTSLLIGGAGTLSVAVAIFHERRMQRHRRPGVGYGEATFRRDGGWRRGDLYTDEGLIHQRLASRYGFGGIGLWILALLSWIALAG